MSIATEQDIADRLGRELDEQEATIVGVRLDDVEELIFQRIPDLGQKIADGKVRERLVVMVECEAVMRLIKNQDGYTSETDGNYTYQISSQVASGRLTVEPYEWSLLGVRSSVVVIGPRIRMARKSWWHHYAEPDEDGDLDTAVWA